MPYKNNDEKTEYFRRYREANKDKIKAYKKEWFDANQEKHKEWVEANKEKIKAYRKEYSKRYREANKKPPKVKEPKPIKVKEPKPIKIKEPKPIKIPREPKGLDKIKRAEYLKEYKNKNKERISQKKKEYYEANKDKLLKVINEWSKNERATNPLYKLKCNVRTLIGNSIRKGGFKKLSLTEQILGCTFEQFKEHLESQFEPWMSWDNRGLYNGTPDYGWDIDHIVPVSSANNEIELLQLNHYTNLKPLCSYINRDVKMAKVHINIDNCKLIFD